MSILFDVGGRLVSQGEMYELGRSGRLESLKTPDGKLEVSTGTIHTRSLMNTLAASKESTVPFRPIGLGKPLTVKIRHMYTGDCPTSWFSTSLLVTSALKSDEQFKAASRAINALKQNVDKRQHPEFRAIEDGTPLVFYSPSITEGDSLLTLEMVTDRFSQDIFDQVSKGLGGAAGIPIFATASLYLLAGSVAIKLLGALGEAIFDGSPFFSATEKIDFGEPGLNEGVAGQAVLVADANRSEILGNFEPDNTGMLVSKTDTRPYAGDTPYITISFDGSERHDYEKFAATSASADILDRFYHVKDSIATYADELIDALKLANDLKFRKKADEQKRTLDGIADHSSDEYKRAQDIYDAYVKNILTEIMKPT